MSFASVKRRVIASLLADDYCCEARQDIDQKNLLAMGRISAAALAQLLKRSGGQHYTCSPHHQDGTLLVHVIVCAGWYVKFYFDSHTLHQRPPQRRPAMKVYYPNDRGSAICHRDGRVTTTFAYRDLPFRDGRGVARNILAGICDICGDAVVIPAQSTPAIAAARRHVEHAMEVNVPAFYLDLLDAAATRVAAQATPDFRKRLLVYYINRYALGRENASELPDLLQRSPLAAVALQGMPNKRLSMKLSEQANQRVAHVMDASRLSKTELIKSLVAKINHDIVMPRHPRHLDELTTIADVLYS